MWLEDRLVHRMQVGRRRDKEGCKLSHQQRLCARLHTCKGDLRKSIAHVWRQHALLAWNIKMPLAQCCASIIADAHADSVCLHIAGPTCERDREESLDCICQLTFPHDRQDGQHTPSPEYDAARNGICNRRQR